jgi:hypothetical protein
LRRTRSRGILRNFEEGGVIGESSADEMSFRIGIDFDNTIVCYDEVFVRTAKAERLIPQDFRGGKAIVRDFIRRLSDGEEKWQRLQGRVYGDQMDGAVLFAGVAQFLSRCRERTDTRVFIVSHKTEFGHFDASGINLREVARAWMTKHRFFEKDGFTLSNDALYFEPTRDQKIERIEQLGCTHFIDDLEEVFGHSRFPAGVRRILFRNGRSDIPAVTYDVCTDWQEIEEIVFANA